MGAHQNTLLERQVVLNEINLSERKANELQSQLSQSKADLQREDQLMEDAESNMVDQKNLLQEVDEKLHDVDEKIENEKEAIEQNNERMQAVDESYNSLRDKLNELRAEKILNEKRKEERSSTLSDLNRNVEKLNDALEKLKNAEQHEIKKLEDLMKEQDNLESTYQIDANNFSKKEKDFQKNQQEIAIVDNEINKLNARMALNISELEASKGLLSKNSDQKTVFDKLEIENGFERCLDALFFSELEYPEVSKNKNQVGKKPLVKKKKKKKKNFSGLENLSSRIR